MVVNGILMASALGAFCGCCMNGADDPTIRMCTTGGLAWLIRLVLWTASLMSFVARIQIPSDWSLAFDVGAPPLFAMQVISLLDLVFSGLLDLYYMIESLACSGEKVRINAKSNVSQAENIPQDIDCHDHAASMASITPMAAASVTETYATNPDGSIVVTKESLMPDGSKISEHNRILQESVQSSKER